MRSPCCLCVYVSPLSTLNAWTIFYESWYIYHGNWAYLSGLLNKFLPPVIVYVLLSLLGNGSVKTLTRQRIHGQQQENCWTRCFLCGPCHINGKEAISSESESESLYDWQSVSLSVLVSSPVWGSWPDIYYLLVLPITSCLYIAM
jgi:hypothetical protein